MKAIEVTKKLIDKDSMSITDDNTSEHDSSNTANKKRVSPIHVSFPHRPVPV